MVGMANFNGRRGVKAVAFGTILFSLLLWLGSGKIPIWTYFRPWQNLMQVAVWYCVFAALVYWLFGRTRSTIGR